MAIKESEIFVSQIFYNFFYSLLLLFFFQLLYFIIFSRLFLTHDIYPHLRAIDPLPRLATTTNQSPRHLATLPSDNFLSKNSAQIQNFTMRSTESLKSAFTKRDKALISGMTDFAHFNDYTLLLNFKLQKLLDT